MKAILFVIASAWLVQACAPVVVGGGAAVGVGAAHDRRSVGTVIDDEAIELTAANILFSDKELYEQTHVNVTSYNYVVLLTGEAATEALRDRVEQAIAGIKGIRRIHNEIRVAGKSSLFSRSSDVLITGKVKTSLLDVDVEGGEDFDFTRVKVVTEAGTVYLMGLVTRAEADAVTEKVRRVGGVQRVIKLFEYLD